MLGPGSDCYHEEHIHVDLAEHRKGFKMCQWDVREPIVQAQTPEQVAARIEDPVPLPRPRPLLPGDKATSQSGKIDSQIR